MGKKKKTIQASNNGYGMKSDFILADEASFDAYLAEMGDSIFADFEPKKSKIQQNHPRKRTSGLPVSDASPWTSSDDDSKIDPYALPTLSEKDVVKTVESIRQSVPKSVLPQSVTANLEMFRHMSVFYNQTNDMVQFTDALGKTLIVPIGSASEPDIKSDSDETIMNVAQTLISSLILSMSPIAIFGLEEYTELGIRVKLQETNSSFIFVSIGEEYVACFETPYKMSLMEDMESIFTGPIKSNAIDTLLLTFLMSANQASIVNLDDDATSISLYKMYINKTNWDFVEDTLLKEFHNVENVEFKAYNIPSYEESLENAHEQFYAALTPLIHDNRDEEAVDDEEEISQVDAGLNTNNSESIPEDDGDEDSSMTYNIGSLVQQAISGSDQKGTGASSDVSSFPEKPSDTSSREVHREITEDVSESGDIRVSTSVGGEKVRIDTPESTTIKETIEVKETVSGVSGDGHRELVESKSEETQKIEEETSETGTTGIHESGKTEEIEEVDPDKVEIGEDEDDDSMVIPVRRG